MRNVFDQYSQAENRLTHALFTALDQDREMLANFLHDICTIETRTPASDLSLTVQQYPDGDAYNDNAAEASSIPDAWIVDPAGQALVFEMKITAPLDKKQLDGHREVAKRFGFESLSFFTVTANPNTKSHPGWTALHWRNIYVWLRHYAQSQTDQSSQTNWANTTADFFEILEAKLLENDKLNDAQLTEFSGFFSSPADYSYVLAKNRLRTAFDTLKQSEKLLKIGLDPQSKGRSAISGKGADFVWDQLSFVGGEEADNFTALPHLTLGVRRIDVEPTITFPNALKGPARRNLLSGGFEAFSLDCRETLDRLSDVMTREPNARPFLRAVQRRYRTQRSTPNVDALLDFDLRTAFPREGKGPKEQPQWIETIFDVFSKKVGTNLQFQIGVSFPYETCPVMNEADALSLIEDVWVACSPLAIRALALEQG